MLTVPLKQWRRYAALSELRSAFEFLEQHADGSGLEPGRTEIDGDRVYALVIDFEPKPPAECRFETHPQHIDVIYLVAGAETIGYAPEADLGPVVDEDKALGTRFYADPEEYASMKLRAGGLVCVCYPEDGHKPFCLLDPAAPARKIVVKVAAGPIGS